MQTLAPRYFPPLYQKHERGAGAAPGSGDPRRRGWADEAAVQESGPHRLPPISRGYIKKRERGAHLRVSLEEFL